MMVKLPDNYWTGKPLLELRLPWLTPGAIEFIGDNVRPSHSVLEFGAGGSTLFFSDLGCRLRSWEPCSKWRKEIFRRLAKHENVFISGSMEDVLAGDAKYDVVLVDGPDRIVSRDKIAPIGIDRVSDSGIFILDNYSRYRVKFRKGWTLRTFDDPHWSGSGTLIAKRE